MSNDIVVDGGDVYGDGLMQSSPFSDEFIVRTRRFADGQQEVVSFCASIRRHFDEIRLRPRGARGKREKLEHETDDDVSARASKSLQTSIERSKRNVRLRCKAIGADRMLTLSVRENETRREVWAKWWDEFRRRLNRLQNFYYVAVLERQERGAWHIHVAVSGRQNWKVLRSIWLSVISKSGTDGAINDSSGNRKMKAMFRRIGGKGRAMRHRIATYIAKYIGKDADASSFNKKRYWTSRGVVVPDVEPWAHLAADCSAKDAIVEAHRAVLSAGGSFDGSQFYWNQGVGVFWLATGNVC